MGIYVEETGNRQAPAIVFLHGGGFGGWIWKEQVTAFQDFHCIIPDLPEHGQSRKTGVFSIREAPEVVARLITERSSSGRAHLVGHSLGGKIGLELLKSRPELVESAVIGSALFRPSLREWLLMSKIGCKLIAARTGNERYLAKEAARLGLKDDFLRQHFLEENRERTLESLERIAVEQYRGLKLPAELGQVRVPVLAIAGALEPAPIKRSVAELTRVFPNSCGAYIKNCQANYTWGAGPVFNQLLRAWLNHEPIRDNDGVRRDKPATRNCQRPD